MMSLEPDHYAVLELRPGSPIEDVKSQYRHLAKMCHPDLHGNDPKCQEQFRRINAAYTFLSDAPRKAMYDACLQVARKNAAPSPKPPPPMASRSSATATGYHAPVTATGYHEQTPTDLRTPTDFRMKRSAWLGATAGLVVILLVIGLSLDGSDHGRPLTVEGASSSALEHAPVGALGAGSAPGGEAAAATLPDTTPSVPFDVPSVGSSEALPPRLPSPPDPLQTGGVDRAQRVPLLRSSHAGMPLRDYAAHVASSDREDEANRVLRERLATDLAELSTARTRVYPDTQIFPQSAPKDSQQEAKASLAVLRRLEDGRRPVRDGLKALSARAFRFTLPVPPAPARSASVMPLLPAPAPRAASAATDAPKPSDTVAAKPKAPASSGQEFIMWGK